MNDKSNRLFTISQAAKACGISRSTLLRMEERGLIKPAYTNPKSGRRYYDKFNVSSCTQILKFQTMGFTNEEILAYYGANGNCDALLSTLEDRLQLMQRLLEEMRLFAQKEQETSLQILHLPPVTCYTKSGLGLTAQDTYDLMAEAYEECIEKGLAISGEPFFNINERTDYLEGYLTKEPFMKTCCVPVIPENIPAAENIVRFPACKVLSLLYYGSYERLDAAYLLLGEEIKKRGLKPAGHVRGIGIVTPATGRNIEEKRYCSRIAVPVE